MSEHAYDGATDDLPAWPPGQGAEQTLKSLAKQLARTATADIDDRHLRARVRTRCYNQTLALLRQVDGRWGEDQRRWRRLSSVAAAIALVTGAALLATLLI